MGAIRRKNRRIKQMIHRNHRHKHLLGRTNRSRRLRRSSIGSISSLMGPLLVSLPRIAIGHTPARNWERVVENKLKMIEMHAF